MQAAIQTIPGSDTLQTLESIFTEYRNRVFAAAYRITGNAEDAEDVVQTVFMRVARRESGTPLSDSPGSYLHRAAINAALDIMRSRKSARATPLDDVSATLPDSTRPSPAEVSQGEELRDHIRRALTKVNDNAAEIFTLRYFEGYGNHEIAKMLGTSRSTINVILHRTRNRLKEELKTFLGDSP